MFNTWTRIKKLTLIGIIAASFVGVIHIEIKYNSLVQEMDFLRIKVAEIDSLKSKVAEIDRLTVMKNIGIGTSIPSEALSVNGAINTFGNTGNSYLNSTGGNVGIGTTNPLAKLEVAGDILIHQIRTGSNQGKSLCIDINKRVCLCGFCN